MSTMSMAYTHETQSRQILDCERLEAEVTGLLRVIRILLILCSDIVCLRNLFPPNLLLEKAS